jgi:hypothetical protein
MNPMNNFNSAQFILLQYVVRNKNRRIFVTKSLAAVFVNLRKLFKRSEKQMPTLIIVFILFILSLFTTEIFGQQQNLQARTQEELVAQFNKTKHKVKEKFGVRNEHYSQVRSEAAVKRPEEYTGVYRLDISGAALELRVSANGAVEGKGEDSEGRDFTLTNGKVEGALLTAAKVYDNGGSEKFEGVFINRTSRTGKTSEDAVDNGTVFGLGVIGQLKNDNDRFFESRRLFYERQR